MKFSKPKTSYKYRVSFLTMRCFGDVFEEKNIDIDVFDDVLQNTKHHANYASDDVNRPPLHSNQMSEYIYLPP